MSSTDNQIEAPVSKYHSKERYPFYWTFFMWNMVEACLESYPIENPTKAQQDELTLWMLLTLCRTPCGICANHALHLWQGNPIDTRNQGAAKEWWFNFHNKVNELIGKPVISAEQAIAESNLVRHTMWPQLWNDLKQNKL